MSNAGTGVGGILSYRGVITAQENTVFGNVGSSGSGLGLIESSATLSENLIIGNLAPYGSYAGGGALLISRATSTAILHQNTISGNMGNGLSGVFIGDLVGNNIINNSGGGLVLSGSRVTLEGNTIADNGASGLSLLYSSATLTNNVVARNQGGALSLVTASLHGRHTTIDSNGSGNGIFITGTVSENPLGQKFLHPSTIALTNTILTRHQVGINVAAGSTATLEATLWGVGTWSNATDWNLACLSNPTLDLGFLLPSLAYEGGPAPDRIMPDAPEVAAWVAGFFAARAGLPTIPDAPRVRSVQRQQLETALPWAIRALDLPPVTGKS